MRCAVVLHYLSLPPLPSVTVDSFKVLSDSFIVTVTTVTIIASKKQIIKTRDKLPILATNIPGQWTVDTLQTDIERLSPPGCQD